MLGRTDTQTRERKDLQSIRTVWDISRDDRAKIATCSLRTATDRSKENYSIDYYFIIIIVFVVTVIIIIMTTITSIVSQTGCFVPGPGRLVWPRSSRDERTRDWREDTERWLLPSRLQRHVERRQRSLLPIPVLPRPEHIHGSHD